MTARATVALCDKHAGEAWPPRCADCDALAEAAETEESCARMLETREKPVTFRDVPWCGECLPEVRMRPVDPDDSWRGFYRCPACNPLAMTATALATALIVAPINPPTESQEGETHR